MKSLYNRTTTQLVAFIKQWQLAIAGGLILLMAILGIGSMVGNSAIIDEIAHVPSAYTYDRYGDYRLNPEHPPLIKNLAGLPLQFLDVKFGSDLVSWTKDVNGQWEAGWYFLYHLGNNPDVILFWSRLPIMLLALGFGAALFFLVRARWGVGVALLTLFFYALSPNFLAHSAFVTTDLGASVFIFLALMAFAYYVERPSKQTFWILALALVGAQLAKFSSVLLYPFMGVLSVAAVFVMPKKWPTKWPEIWQGAKTYVGGFLGASVVSLGGIWLYYIPNTWNMPANVQDALIQVSVTNDTYRGVAEFLMSINNIPLLKSIGQYILGLLMVFGRVAGGNVTYFNGEVTNQSFHWYFPELFALKTQVALEIMFVAVVVVVAVRTLRSKRKFTSLATHMRTHVAEWALAGFGLFYFGISVAGNLNLGIRHVLPVYVPFFVLTAIGVIMLMRKALATKRAPLAAGVFAVLLAWYAGSTVVNYPNFISYFNEIIGGSGNSGKYFSDSSVDWGQDLKRLKTYVDKHPEINHLALDYFGGGLPQYYFCQRKYDDNGRLVATSAGYDCSKSVYEEWHAQYGRYTGEYIAVSETFLQNDRFYAELNDRPGYEYLREQEPMVKIGNSIYLYKLK